MMQIATKDGKVVLAGNGLPTEWNGSILTVFDLTDEQAKAYADLPERKVTRFDGIAFSVE